MLCPKARGQFAAVHLHPEFSHSAANAACVLGSLL